MSDEKLTPEEDATRKPEATLTDAERVELQDFRGKALLQAKALQDAQYRQMRDLQNFGFGTSFHQASNGPEKIGGVDAPMVPTRSLLDALLMAGRIKDREPVGDPATASMPKIIGRVSAIMVLTIAAVVLGLML